MQRIAMHRDGKAKSPSIPTARAASPLVAMGGLVLIWVLQEWASSVHSYKDSLITPWNPGIGILFAVIIREGVLYGLALFVGVVCAEFVTRSGALGLPVTMVSAGIIAGAYTSAAVVARNHFPINVELSRLRDGLILILTGVGSAFVVAILLSLLLVTTGRLKIEEPSSAYVRGMLQERVAKVAGGVL